MNERIILLGDKEAGKSSLMQAAMPAFAKNIAPLEIIGGTALESVAAPENKMQTSVGFSLKMGHNEKIHINLTKNPQDGYKDALCVIVCCDASKPAEVSAIQTYINQLEEHKTKESKRLPLFVLFTKADLNPSVAPSSEMIDLLRSQEDCYYLGSISALNDDQEAVFALLRKAIKISTQNANPEETFFNLHKALTQAKFGPLFLHKSHITPDSKWPHIILNARHKKTASSKQVLLTLGWMDENNSITPEAPKALHDAEKEIQEKKLTFKK